MGEKLREKLNFDKFMEIQAKTKYNIKNLFVEATKLLYKDYTKNKQNMRQSGENSREEDGGCKNGESAYRYW